MMPERGWIGTWLLAAATATAAPDSATSEIDALQAHCPVTRDNLPSRVDASCTERLERRFASAPIWDGATMRYVEYGQIRTHQPRLNVRARHLGFTRADRLQGDAPAWSDIFDGLNHTYVVAGVIGDPDCAALNQPGGIQVALNQRCRARDLFKYATYLDACTTASDRSHMLHDYISGGVSQYDMLVEEANSPAKTSGRPLVVDEHDDWEHLLGGGEETPGRRRVAADGRDATNLVEMSLLAIWLEPQCSPFSFLPIDRDLRQVIGEGETQYEGDEFLDAVRPGHDAALAIAARAGDPWAVQAFYVDGLADDIEYWKSLRDFNPLLLHRWMATTTVGAALGLGPPDRALHALMAFAIERRTAPDLELDSYLALYGLPPDSIAPSWRRGGALWDAAIIEDSLAYPWDTAR